ncbi:MAG TPA: NADH-quinone oxidoreductase subunit C [Kofleriaceae bacterium]|nr:NADH-quinone oxidoreductase subunit C [Kofleriaceae bacterium]
MAKQILDALAAKFAHAVERTESNFGDEVAWIKRENLVEVAKWLRDEQGFAFPVFCTCIDRLDWKPIGLPPSEHWNESKPRFEIAYQLRSLKNQRIRLKVAVTEADPRVQSLAELWPAFNWQERETFDMYGIRFDGHPDLRRIYLYEEFVGYPLRKDYPKEKRQPLVRRDDLILNPLKKEVR